VHIDNLVHAIMLSLTRGHGGEIYFVTDGEVVTLRQFIEGYLATQGVVPKDRSLPSWLVDPVAGVLEDIWKAVGAKNPPPITRFAAMIMSRECTLRIDKIRRDMGYEPRINLAKGLAEMPKQ
jgi:nucleoside-diphosphate-sugar epimerase